MIIQGFIRWALVAVVLLLSFHEEVSAAEETATTTIEFEVQLAKGKTDKFQIEVHPDWAPIGAARFLELVDEGESFWKGIRFFRVIEGFMAQFGIPGKPALAEEWRKKTIVDDDSDQSNERGYLSFATSGQDSRTTQMFINLVDNSNLDDMGFSPFAKVLGDGMSVVDEIYSGYGEGAPGGNGPAQGRIQSEGNTYLKKQFPNLSYVKSVRRVDGAEAGEL